MKKDLTRTLVESAVRTALKKIWESPERATRNLIDLGLQFSKGRFQTELLGHAQKMLQNEESAYYTLVKNIVTTVDHEILTTFGVNLGYNSCTKGAQLIRKTEEEQGFNIPWALHLVISGEKLRADPNFYSAILRQGTAFGIYTYCLFVTGNAENIISLIQQQPDCAFILFLHGSQVNSSFIQKMHKVCNTMISVYTDEQMPPACQMLRDAHMLYAVYQRYNETDKPKIINGEWINSVLPAMPAFAMLRADFSCTPETQKEIYQYVLAVRDGQQYPLLCVDIKQDTLKIDQIISDGECLAGFDADGSLRTHEGFKHEKQCNIFYHDLKEILRYTSKKRTSIFKIENER